MPACATAPSVTDDCAQFVGERVVFLEGCHIRLKSLDLIADSEDDAVVALAHVRSVGNDILVYLMSTSTQSTIEGRITIDITFRITA